MVVGWPVGDDSESREHTALAEARLLLAGAGLCSLSSVITPEVHSTALHASPGRRRPASPLPRTLHRENQAVRDTPPSASAKRISHPSATPRHRACDGREHQQRWPRPIIRKAWVELLIFAGRERGSVMDDKTPMHYACSPVAGLCAREGVCECPSELAVRRGSETSAAQISQTRRVRHGRGLAASAAAAA
jgi:hypothetical protein